MSGNTKALRLRIKSTTSTLQLTKAMGLVAASKIYRSNIALKKAREYSTAFDKALAELTSDSECEKSPFMAIHNTGKTRIVVIAGDRGLAGGYNANVFRLASTMENAEFIPIGKRACDRYGKPFISSEHFSFGDAAKIANQLCADFAEGEFDKLGIIYTKYISAMTQEATLRWVLPLEKIEGKSSSNAIYEPDALTILNHTVREYVTGMISACIRESFASEVAARRMAMDSAGKNAKQMIDDLGLQYNRARQGAITQEITEIVAGSGNPDELV
ncbi:MAG: ATP synthase F1 subunit gamma [Ruminococcaceae bacterium]|nr:ATP synthase F1 subunit gamma [Oscillospiraceae bacterium]